MPTIYAEIAKKAKLKRELCEKFSAEYAPIGEIELLVVGESPPIGDAYFYIPEDLRRRHQGLPAKIFRGLFGASIKIDKEQCARFLDQFQERNFLLTDIVKCPVDCLVPAERAKIIENELDAFRNSVMSLNLSDTCIKVMILPSGTWRELQSQKYSKVWTVFEDLGFKIIKWGQVEEEFQNIANELKRKNVL